MIMTSNASGPQQRYDALIDEGVVSQDAGQADIIDQLDQLYHRLLPHISQHHKSVSKKFLKLFRSPKKSQNTLSGLYIYGGVGRGKSMMMDLFYDCLPSGTAKRLHFHDFMVMAHDAMNDARQAGADDAVSQAGISLSDGPKILCFDEMEVRDIADAMILKRLFDSLFARGVIVVATSNRHPDHLYENGLHRDRFLPFIDQLKDHCIITQIQDGNDWRTRLLATMPRWYITDEATDHKATLATQFSHLTQGADIAPLSVRVAGRDVVFDTAAQAIVMASFNELCAVPLAARDYVALADRLTGLFITDIPRLGDAEQNEARRFMWLIDALYDRGRFVVATAQTDMTDLYHGSQWAFEFHRTISRLSEMTRLN